MPLGPGSELGPFKIVDQLGRGGMATVYKAYQPALERHVAIKVLPDFFASDPEFKTRFHREAVAVASLRHPNILHVFDHGESGGLTYIVSELVEGGTLDDRLGKPMPLDEAAAILGPIAAAVDYAHSQGILHRDIKPSNVLIAKDGTPILGDFGLAKMTGTNLRLTRTGMIVGTPEYMAPEQCEGEEPSGAADIYSLAVVAYEMLTGKVPFSAATPAAVMLAQIQNPLPAPHSINPSLSPSVDAALTRALAKDPAERPASCGELVRNLRGDAAPVASKGRRPRMIDRRRILVLGGAGALVVLGGGTLAGLMAARRPTLTFPGAGSTAEPTGLPAHGPLIYEALLRGDDLSDITVDGAEIRQKGGTIEVAPGRADGSASAEFKTGRVKSYLLALVMTVSPGTDIEVQWPLRSPVGTEDADVYMSLETADETLIAEFSPYKGDNAEITPLMPVKGLQSGRPLTLAVLVDGDRYAFFVDGTKVGDVRERRVTGATMPGFNAYPKSGAWRLASVRYYSLG